MRVLTFEQFATSRGASASGQMNAGLHNPMGHLPAAARRRIMKTEAARQDALQCRRDALRTEYAKLIELGEVREPTNQESLEAAARGNPENASTLAAQRVLAKRLARQEAA